MKNRLCWTDIPVTDLDRAVAFYSAVLGAPVKKQQAGPEMEFGLLPLPDGEEGASGCLAHFGAKRRPSIDGPLVYLSVEGRLDAAAAAVAKHGGKIDEPKHAIGPWGFRVLITDSEGNRLALHSQAA